MATRRATVMWDIVWRSESCAHRPVEAFSGAITHKGPLHAESGVSSIQGPWRDTNEDYQYVSPAGAVFIVADGIGGRPDGEVASQLAVEVLALEFDQISVEATEKEIADLVIAALNRAHHTILGYSGRDPEARSPGTTVVCGVLVNHQLYVASVGDSRAYLVRDDSIQRLTVDDTCADVLFHLGRISAEQAKRHYLRNVLTSGLGMESFDASDHEVQTLDVHHGDHYLFATDGLTDVVPEERLFQLVREHETAQTAAEALTREAIIAGATDDVSCVVVHLHGCPS